jgi:hypothetical protein
LATEKCFSATNFFNPQAPLLEKKPGSVFFVVNQSAHKGMELAQVFSSVLHSVRVIRIALVFGKNVIPKLPRPAAVMLPCAVDAKLEK